VQVDDAGWAARVRHFRRSALPISDGPARGPFVGLGARSLEFRVVDLHPHTERLRHALRQMVRRQRSPLATLSRELGRSATYLSKALGTGAHLKVTELFQLLALLSVEPREFFYLFFPLGGEAQLAIRRRWTQRLPPEVLGKPPDGLDQPLRTEPGEWAGDVARLLRERLAARGFTQAEVAERLRLSPQAFGHALRGSTRLHVGHLFAALAAIDESPERFFFELIAPAQGLAADLAWSETLDEVEKAVDAVLRDAPRTPPPLRSG
jgi:transcriptional regulator with XRE-family HTH domain